MKALVCENFGPPETLRIVDLADPVAGEGEGMPRTAALARCRRAGAGDHA